MTDPRRGPEEMMDLIFDLIGKGAIKTQQWYCTVAGKWKGKHPSFMLATALGWSEKETREAIEILNVKGARGSDEKKQRSNESRVVFFANRNGECLPVHSRVNRSWVSFVLKPDSGVMAGKKRQAHQSTVVSALLTSRSSTFTQEYDNTSSGQASRRSGKQLRSRGSGTSKKKRDRKWDSDNGGVSAEGDVGAVGADHTNETNDTNQTNHTNHTVAPVAPAGNDRTNLITSPSANNTIFDTASRSTIHPTEDQDNTITWSHLFTPFSMGCRIQKCPSSGRIIIFSIIPGAQLASICETATRAQMGGDKVVVCRPGDQIVQIGSTAIPDSTTIEQFKKILKKSFIAAAQQFKKLKITFVRPLCEHCGSTEHAMRQCPRNMLRKILNTQKISRIASERAIFKHFVKETEKIDIAIQQIQAAHSQHTSATDALFAVNLVDQLQLEKKCISRRLLDLRVSLVQRGACGCDIEKTTCPVCQKKRRRRLNNNNVAHPKTAHSKLASFEVIRSLQHQLVSSKKEKKKKAHVIARNTRIDPTKVRDNNKYESAVFDDFGNIRSALNKALVLMNNGDMKNRGITLSYNGKPLISAKGGELEWDRKRAQHSNSLSTLNNTASKNKYESERTDSGKALLTYGHLQRLLKKRNFNLNEPIDEAITQFALVNIVNLFKYACGAHAYAGSLPYCLFLMRGKQLVDEKHLRLLFIGEQLLRICHDDTLPMKTFYSTSFEMTTDTLEDCLTIAQEIMHRLKTCQDKVEAMPMGRRFAVLVALIYRPFYRYVAIVSGCQLELVMLYMSVTFHFDDVHTNEQVIRVGKYSETVGLVDLPAPFQGGDIDGLPEPIREVSIGSISQKLGHNRRPLSAYPHLKQGTGPILGDQFNDTVSRWFHLTGTTPGLVHVLHSTIVDHLPSGMKVLRENSAILTGSHPNKKQRMISIVDEANFLGSVVPYADQAIETNEETNVSGSPLYSLGLLTIIDTLYPECLFRSKPQSLLQWQRFGKIHGSYEWTMVQLRTCNWNCYNWFNATFGMARNFQSDSLIHPPIREQYNGMEPLSSTKMLGCWKTIGEVDAILEQLHSASITTVDLFVKASKFMESKNMKMLRSKNTWTHVGTSDTGGITVVQIPLFTIQQINTILKLVMTSDQTLAQFSKRPEKAAELERIILAKNVPRTGELEKARALVYYHSTCNVSGQNPIGNCLVHLVKSQLNRLVSSTERHPVYVCLEVKGYVKRLMKEMQHDMLQKNKDEEAEAERIANESLALMSLAERIQHRTKKYRRKQSTFFGDSDSDEDSDAEGGGKEEGRRNEFANDHLVLDPPPNAVAIYRDLMLYLYVVVGAMMEIKQGNVCRWLLLKHWWGDSFTKMEYRRVPYLMRCVPFIECVVYDFWDSDVDEKRLPFPWDACIDAVPGLTKPTAKMRLGFLGIIEWCRRKRIVFMEYFLCRRFSNMQKLEAAEEIHVLEMVEHLRFNPTCTSDIVQGRVQSRYQGIEGQGQNLLWARRLHEFAQDAPKVQSREYLQGGVTVSELPIIIKVGLWNNSTLENMIGHIRYLCNSGTLTGANIAYVWRKFMALRLQSNHRTSARKRKDLEGLTKQIEEFHNLKPAAEHRAVYLVYRDLVEQVVIELDIAIEEMAE